MRGVMSRLPPLTAIRAFEGRYSSVLLAHHGPVVAGKTLDEAASAADELEETARLHLLLLAHRPRSLTAQEIGDLVTTFRPGKRDMVASARQKESRTKRGLA